MGQLIESDYSISFNDGVCDIKDKKKKKDYYYSMLR